ncbi:uncharacterized protein LOC117823262 [Notolabrus celidotus]|uniref:uncharacterized protein LOC117823262 n=1 Tax=Notolabrus celidotus TaxID=1203425 RepID=UPI0014902EF3|nr:uncharacterized protein LOC117823262 [Notolabrus celidotus]
MPLIERQQMNLDTVSTTHARMEAQSRPSQKYVLLQVWCGLLTVALVVMAALLTSVKPKSSEGDMASQGSDYVTPAGSSPSFIQLIKSQDSRSWTAEHECESCSLDLRNDSIHCRQTSLYFLYAQVTFSRHPKNNKTKSVIVKRNASFGMSRKKLVEGTFPITTQGSVWVAKIVSLTEGDSISLDITDDFLTETTFWGAYQLQ